VRKSYLAFLLILIPCLALATSHNLGNPAVTNLENHAIMTGSETVDAPVIYPPYNLMPTDGVDIIGDTLTIGTSWYDMQHNGTVGRMVEKSDDGYLHFVWMNGTNSGASDRHVYYNTIDPSGTQGWYMAGYGVESAQRGGYTTLDVDYGGIAFPCFHQVTGSSMNAHTAVGTDFFPHAGAFLVYEPDWLYIGGAEQEIIWPRIMFDRNQTMHVVSTENPLSQTAGDPQRHYYTVGSYDPLTYEVTFPDDPDTWTEMSWTMTIAGDLATSDVSDRVAFAWCWSKDFGGPDTSQWNNDIYVMIDDDGQDFHFENYFNLTQFIDPDPSWLPDTLMANMDTLRAYTDLNIFIDQDDYCHIVFTTPSYFELEGTRYWHASIVWHWSEQFPGEFQMVHNAFDDWDWNYIDCGAWQVKAQRPSIGQDPATGDLYCMYQVYDCDTTAISMAGMPSGEVYMSKSIDGGQNWSVGINITETITPENATAGNCLSELSPTMAKLVDGTCHIMYVLDRDAGVVVQTEGTWTFNEIKYHSVAVDLIPASPTVVQDVPLHVAHAYPQPGMPGVNQNTQPQGFALSQNYPNPFNPVTTINFSLDEVSDVSLKVFNLLGEEVANVTSGTYGTGAHSVAFDGSNLASGIYLYKLEAGSKVETRKMLLLK